MQNEHLAALHLAIEKQTYTDEITNMPLALLPLQPDLIISPKNLI